MFLYPAIQRKEIGVAWHQGRKTYIVDLEDEGWNFEQKQDCSEKWWLPLAVWVPSVSRVYLAGGLVTEVWTHESKVMVSRF